MQEILKRNREELELIMGKCGQLGEFIFVDPEKDQYYLMIGEECAHCFSTFVTYMTDRFGFMEYWRAYMISSALHYIERSIELFLENDLDDEDIEITHGEHFVYNLGDGEEENIFKEMRKYMKSLDGRNDAVKYIKKENKKQLDTDILFRLMASEAQDCFEMIKEYLLNFDFAASEQEDDEVFIHNVVKNMVN